MVGPHQALGAVAQAARIPGLLHGAGHVAERVGRVNRFDAGRAALQHKAPARVIKLGGFTAALGAQVGGQVFGAQQRAADARAGACDFAQVHYAQSGLAHGQDFCCAFRYAQCAFQRSKGFVQRAHVQRGCALGVGHDVGAPRHHFLQVLVAIGLQRVDAHTHQRTGVAPALVQRRGQGAGLGAARGRGEVFQVLDQHVGAAGYHGVMGGAVRARAEQPGAAQRRGEPDGGGDGHDTSIAKLRIPGRAPDHVRD
jgi:hypothetical protein